MLAFSASCGTKREPAPANHPRDARREPVSVPSMRLTAVLLGALLLLSAATPALADGARVTLRLELDHREAVRGGQTGLEIFA